MERQLGRGGYDDLTVGEVKAINDSLQSLKFIGRKEGKYLVMGESHVKSQLIGNMDNQLSRWESRRISEQIRI